MSDILKQIKRLVIETDETRFHIDGEPLEISGKVVVRIKKEVLKVLKTPGNKYYSPIVTFFFSSTIINLRKLN